MSGIIGLLIICAAIWFRDQKWQDILFVAGGAALLVYSIGIGDKVFITLQIVFIVSAAIELFKEARAKL